MKFSPVFSSALFSFIARCLVLDFMVRFFVTFLQTISFSPSELGTPHGTLTFDVNINGTQLLLKIQSASRTFFPRRFFYSPPPSQTRFLLHTPLFAWRLPTAWVTEDLSLRRLFSRFHNDGCGGSLPAVGTAPPLFSPLLLSTSSLFTRTPRSQSNVLLPSTPKFSHPTIFPYPPPRAIEEVCAPLGAAGTPPSCSSSPTPYPQREHFRSTM